MGDKTQYEKYLDAKAKEKQKLPTLKISKTVVCNWDDWAIWPWNWGRSK